MPTVADILDTGLLGFIEVIEGDIVTSSPNSYKQNLVAQNLYRILNPASAVGLLMRGHMSYVLKRVGDDVHTMRLPDVSYTRHMPSFGAPSLLPTAPDFAVKVVAAYETAAQHERLIGDYLAAGTLLVWLVYPEQGEIHTFESDGRIGHFVAADTATVEDIFPIRAAVPLREVFTYPWD